MKIYSLLSGLSTSTAPWRISGLPGLLPKDIMKRALAHQTRQPIILSSKDVWPESRACEHDNLVKCLSKPCHQGDAHLRGIQGGPGRLHQQGTEDQLPFGPGYICSDLLGPRLHVHDGVRSGGSWIMSMIAEVE